MWFLQIRSKTHSEMVWNAFQIRLQMRLSLDTLVAHIGFQHVFCVTYSATHNNDVQRNRSASEQLLGEQYGREHILWTWQRDCLERMIIYISPASPVYIATKAYAGTTTSHAAMLEFSGHLWILVFFRSNLRNRSNCQLCAVFSKSSSRLTSSKLPSMGLYASSRTDLIRSPTRMKSPLVFR